MSSVHTLGVPVRSVNWVRIFPALDAEDRDCLVAVMGQQADGFMVVQVDPVTGDTDQVTATLPSAYYPTATLLSRSGVIYIGAAYAGYLFCYDPKTGRLDNLGAISLPDDTFPCRIDEDAQGVLWIGCYGSAGLTSYDPQAGEFVRYGRMDETDMYCYPMCAPDGTVACDIKMTRPHVVVLNPKTGVHRAVGPVVAKEDGGASALMRASDGSLYIASSEGNFRLAGFEAVRVDTLPEPESLPTMSDGAVVDFADRDTQMYRVVGITQPETGATRRLPITYKSAGSELFLVHRGPDDNIYGSSILPLHLFRYVPSSGEMTDLGVCSMATGEAYSMGNLDGKLYICSYPGARLSVYDPSRPYRFGLEADSNPRDLGRVDEVSYRPRAMVTGPMGRVWIASVPDYGLWGGPLSWFDPGTETFGTYRDIAGEASCWSLAWLSRQDLLAVGTTINGGSGTRPRVSQAVLFLWDYEGEEKVWEGTLDRRISAINALVVGEDSLLYGTALGDGGPVLFAFDPVSRAFHYAIPLDGRPLDLGLQNGPDGKLYGFTTGSFYAFDPAHRAITPLYEEQDAFQVPGPVMGNNVYFAKKHEVKRLVI